jgi:uncharacterized integral membrane protein (TIGR00698 family)
MRASTLAVPAAFNRSLRFAAGVVLSFAAAALAIGAAQLDWFRSHGIGALTLAIVCGIAVGNTVYERVADAADDGVQFTRQTLLRIGIVLYGFRLSLADLAQVGIAGAAIDAIVLASTFGLAAWIGVRVLKLDRDTALLIGAGNAICGAAAVMATEPVLRARSEQAAVAVATVVVFGSLAMFAYPALYQMVQARWPDAVSAHAFGIYAGSTIHEVAQVMVAGRALGDEAAHAAVVAKMMRVMMLAPFLLLLSALVARRATANGAANDRARRIVIPWFAFLFVAVIVLRSALHSFLPLPASLVRGISSIDDIFLAMAMAALGFMTRIAAVRRAGPRCLILAAILFAWLTIGGATINWLMLR